MTRSEVYQSPFSVFASLDHSQSTPEFDKVVQQSAVFSPPGENSLRACFDWFRSYWAKLQLTRRSASDLHPGDPWPPHPHQLISLLETKKGDQVLIQAEPPLLWKVRGISEVRSATSAWIISFNNQTTQIWFPSPCSAFFFVFLFAV